MFYLPQPPKLSVSLQASRSRKWFYCFFPNFKFSRSIHFCYPVIFLGKFFFLCVCVGRSRSSRAIDVAWLTWHQTPKLVLLLLNQDSFCLVSLYLNLIWDIAVIVFYLTNYLLWLHRAFLFQKIILLFASFTIVICATGAKANFKISFSFIHQVALEHLLYAKHTAYFWRYRGEHKRKGCLCLPRASKLYGKKFRLIFMCNFKL